MVHQPDTFWKCQVCGAPATQELSITDARQRATLHYRLCDAHRDAAEAGTVRGLTIEEVASHRAQHGLESDLREKHPDDFEKFKPMLEQLFKGRRAGDAR